MTDRHRILVAGGAGCLGSHLVERLLADSQEFTIVGLAKLVIELSGSPSRIVHRPLPSDDPRQRRPDITRARRLLGWRPTIGLREGLLHTIACFEERLNRRPKQLLVIAGSARARRSNGAAVPATAPL